MAWLYRIGDEIDGFFAALRELSKQEKDVIAVATIAVGGLFCFLGYRFFKYILGLAGFLVGGLIGLAASNIWFAAWPEAAKYALAAAAGALGAVAFYFLFYYFGIFVFGAAASMWVALVALPKLLGQYRALVILGIGFAGGLLALLLRRQLMIVCTAAIGAMAIMVGIGYFYHWPLSITELSLSETIDGTLIETVLADEDGVLSLVLMGLFLFSGVLIQSLIPEKRRLRAHER